MKNALKYYVGIAVKNDRRQVFGAHKAPTAATHGRHFAAVIGPFTSLRAAYYVRDHGANNPQIRCPADAEKLCRVRPGPGYQRAAGKRRRNPITVTKVVTVRTTRTGKVKKGRARLRRALKSSPRRARRAAPVRRRKNPAGAVFVVNRQSGERHGPMPLDKARGKLAAILKTWRPLHPKGKFPYWIESERRLNPRRKRKLSPAQLRAGFGGKRRRNSKTSCKNKK